MKISVALCTCNGGPYVAEQLASIAAQDCPPDELVVCDDCSADATAAIVERFAAAAPCEVRLVVNGHRLGTRENFSQAVALCRGQWIVLADQDDVWMPHKLRLLTGTLARNDRIGLVFSDALLTDQQRRPLGYTLWEALHFTSAEQRQVNNGRAASVLLRRNVVTGATMALRADYRDLLLPIPSGWVHDGWFALLIAAVAECAAIGEPLMEYRQHPQQQIGARKQGLFQQYQRVKQRGSRELEAIAEEYLAARDRLRRFQNRLRDPGLLAALQRKAEHFRAKARMRQTTLWRLPLVARELMSRHYSKYSTGWKSLAQDLFL